MTKENERKISGSIHVDGKLETSFSENLLRQHKTERDEDTANSNKDRNIEIATLIVVSIYTALAALQWCSTRDAVNAAREANNISQKTFITAQGPQVYTEDAIMKEFAAGKKIAIDMQVKNFGHLAANDFSIGAKIYLSSGDPVKTIDSREIKNATSLAPDKVEVITYYSDFLLNSPQIDEIRKGEMIIYITGAYSYENPLDPGKISYSVFCSKYDPSRQDGRLMGCPFAPDLLVNGKPMIRTHELQQMP